MKSKLLQDIILSLLIVNFLEAQVNRYKLNERYAIDLSAYEIMDTLTRAP